MIWKPSASGQPSLEVGYRKGPAPEESCELRVVIRGGCFAFWLSACLSSLLSFQFPFLMIFFQLCSLSPYFCLLKWRTIKASCPREIVKNNAVAKLCYLRELWKSHLWRVLKNSVNMRRICTRFCLEEAGAWGTTTRALAATNSPFFTSKVNPMCGFQPRKD